MLNVGRILRRPALQQSFIVHRSTGTWVNGLWTTTNAAALEFSGVIQPLNSEEIQKLPGGDAITGGIKVYSEQPIQTTKLAQSGETGTSSDEVEWQGERWIVI